MKTMVFTLSFLLIVFCGFVFASHLIQFGKIETKLEIKSSVTLNGKSFDETIKNSIEVIAGNVAYYDLEIINHCNESINITVSHDYKCKDVELDVYILYNDSIIDFPFICENNTEYDTKIAYDTNYTSKPCICLVTSKFYFADGEL